MNLTHLIALCEMLDRADMRIAAYQDTGQFLKPFGIIIGHTYDFKHKTEITRRAKLRILSAIERELIVLRTECKLEQAECETPANSSYSDLANVSQKSGVHSVFDQVLSTLQTIPGSGYENFTPAQVQASSKSGLATKSPGLSGPVLKERVRR